MTCLKSIFQLKSISYKLALDDQELALGNNLVASVPNGQLGRECSSWSKCHVTDQVSCYWLLLRSGFLQEERGGQAFFRNKGASSESNTPLLRMADLNNMNCHELCSTYIYIYEKVYYTMHYFNKCGQKFDWRLQALCVINFAGYAQDDEQAKHSHRRWIKYT